MTRRKYEQLTPKMQEIVDYFIEHGLDETTAADAADHAGCSDSYANKVRNEQEELIQERIGMKAMADGGEREYTVSLTESEAWTIMRTAPSEVSQSVFDQVRN